MYYKHRIDLNQGDYKNIWELVNELLKSKLALVKFAMEKVAYYF